MKASCAIPTSALAALGGCVGHSFSESEPSGRSDVARGGFEEPREPITERSSPSPVLATAMRSLPNLDPRAFLLRTPLHPFPALGTGRSLVPLGPAPRSGRPGRRLAAGCHRRHDRKPERDPAHRIGPDRARHPGGRPDGHGADHDDDADPPSPRRTRSRRDRAGDECPHRGDVRPLPAHRSGGRPGRPGAGHPGGAGGDTPLRVPGGQRSRDQPPRHDARAVPARALFRRSDPGGTCRSRRSPCTPDCDSPDPCSVSEGARADARR